MENIIQNYMVYAHSGYEFVILTYIVCNKKLKQLRYINIGKYIPIFYQVFLLYHILFH